MERLVTDMTETEILFDLLEKGISPAHAVSACEKRLTDAGFEVVDYGMAWNLKAGGKYVINHHGTTLFAFTLPQNWSDREPAIRIAAAHTDFPLYKSLVNGHLGNSLLQIIDSGISHIHNVINVVAQAAAL